MNNTYRLISAKGLVLATYKDVAYLNHENSPLVVLKNGCMQILAVIHLGPGERLIQEAAGA